MDANEFYVIIKYQPEDQPFGPQQQSETPDKKKSDSANKIAGLVNQAVGYIPGGSQVISTANAAGNAATNLAALNYIGIASLALSLAKKAYDAYIEYKNEQYQSQELRRRAYSVRG